ncbi:hypothetical protein N9S92_00750 [Candidatus Pelagibacter sp.]|nr:hypothetical protein [Candidatus Pelagibacter sp.]MDA9646279.1 hypothetical protein [Candidatus Pelagibacter sp.]
MTKFHFKPSNKGLLKFRDNYYSQNGEDGIILELIKRLDLNKLEVCEFGAWNGVHLSNTFNLIKNYNAKAVLIEGDEEKFKDLIKTSKSYKNITPIQAYINIKENSLDKILSNTFLKKDFDILSIDIDSNDLEIWESLNNYSPKIVIIEIQSNILPGIIERYNYENKTFNSFTSTIKSGINKGYTAVAHTGNLLFVRNDYLNKVNLEKNLIDNSENLFIYDWVNKDRTKRYLKKVLPKFIVSILKTLKKYFIRLFSL